LRRDVVLKCATIERKPPIATRIICAMDFFNRPSKPATPPATPSKTEKIEEAQIVGPSKPAEVIDGRALPRATFETVLGATSVAEGKLHCESNVRLDGTFSGTLEITGNVLVGETAKINADINAHHIAIAGTVRGNVSGQRVQLLRTARVWGDIQATSLTTEDGAFIEGKVKMLGG
jgi:cytoskeletal protein CcmA (bactofilin family)